MAIFLEGIPAILCPSDAGCRGVDRFWKRGHRRASKNYFFQLIDFPCDAWIPRNGPTPTLAQVVKTIYTACCRLKKRRFLATEPPTRTLIVNSRTALRNAQALVGFRAFVRGLATGPMSEHGGREDRPDPGGSLV